MVEERNLVRLVQIDDVRAIEDAQNLDLVTVGGWNVVSQKGLYSIGDSCWYHEIDSLLPLDNPAYAFLASRGIKEVNGKQYHRLRTIKLRGQISQGLLVPLHELDVPFSSSYYWTLDQTIYTPFVNPTEYLGVLKYDDVVTVNAGNGDTAGSFPIKYGNKTDAERVQNLTRHWEAIKAEEWIATEKIDGCSLSVFRDDDGNLRVCSRNWEVKNGGNVYWNAVRKYQNLFDKLPISGGIQAEIYGEGIQKNRLGVKDQHIAIFNTLYKGVVEPNMYWDLLPEYVGLEVPTYDLELPDTVEEAIAQADGIKSLINPDRLAEGIVWTNPYGKVLPFLGRHCFKVISNKFLLRFE